MVMKKDTKLDKRSQQTLNYLNRNKVEVLPNQLSLFPDITGQEDENPEPDKIKKIKGQRIVDKYFKQMYYLCYNATTENQIGLLSKAQKGMVAQVLGKLRDNNMDLNLLFKFQHKWRQHWKSGHSGTYYPPRPHQILEHWSEFFPSPEKPDRPKEEKNETKNIMNAMYTRGTNNG